MGQRESPNQKQNEGDEDTEQVEEAPPVEGREADEDDDNEEKMAVVMEEGVLVAEASTTESLPREDHQEKQEDEKKQESDDEDEVVVVSTTQNSSLLLQEGLQKTPPLHMDMHMATSSMTMMMPFDDLVKLHASKTIRMNASDVAAMAGFHPYKNLPQLLHKLVYQGPTGQRLLHRDAQALQLDLVASEEEIWRSLAGKAGQTTQKALETVLHGKTSKSVQQADALKAEVVKQARTSGKLNATELKVLQDGARHTVNTRFGTYHEDNALDQCEQKFGYEIYNRNAQVMEWPFQKVDDDSGNATVVPIGAAVAYWTSYQTKSYGLSDVQSTWRAYGGCNDGNNHSMNKRQKFGQGVVDLTTILNLGVDNQAFLQIGDYPIVSEKMPAADQSEKAAPTGTIDNSTNSDPATTAPKLEAAAQDKGSIHASASHPRSNPAETPIDVTKSPIQTQVKSSKASPLTRHNSDTKAPTREPHPFFVIRGAVDGMHDEPIFSSDNQNFNDDNWAMQPVVVELKHRMNKFFNPPPFYDQVQAVAYCFMYNVEGADLVQVLRREYDSKEGKSKTSRNDDVESKDPNCSADSQKQQPSATKTGAIRDYFPPHNQGTKEKNQEEVPEEKSSSSKVKNDAEMALPETIGDSIMDSAGEVTNECTNASRTEDSDIAMEPADKDKQGAGETCDSGVASPPMFLKNDSEGLSLKVAANECDGDNKKAAAVDNTLHDSQPMLLQVDRISLDDPVFQHRKQWRDMVLPRLRSFADAVYNIRKDDSKRYRLLLACSDPLGQLEKDAWELLHGECPWLKNCDTAFNRN